MPAKPRGLSRRCANMVRAIQAQTATFPCPHLERDFWHWHPPLEREIVGPRAPFGVRRFCVQTLLDGALRLTTLAPQDQTTRVVVAINATDFWRSQIIVFFGAEYYERFFERDSSSQIWKPLPHSRSVAREWNLEFPDSFAERGFRETLNEPGFHEENELWFFGQLND